MLLIDIVTCIGKDEGCLAEAVQGSGASRVGAWTAWTVSRGSSHPASIRHSDNHELPQVIDTAITKSDRIFHSEHGRTSTLRATRRYPQQTLHIPPATSDITTSMAILPDQQTTSTRCRGRKEAGGRVQRNVSRIAVSTPMADIAIDIRT